MGRADRFMGCGGPAGEPTAPRQKVFFIKTRVRPQRAVALRKTPDATDRDGFADGSAEFHHTAATTTDTLVPQE